MKKFSVIPTAFFVFFIAMMLLSPSLLHLISAALACYSVFHFISAYRGALCWSHYVLKHANNRKFWIFHLSIITPPFFLLLSPPVAIIPAILGASLYLIAELILEAKKDWLIY